MTSQGFPFPFLGIGTVHEAEAVPVTPAPKFQFVSHVPNSAPIHLYHTILTSHHLILPYLAHPSNLGTGKDRYSDEQG